MYEFEFEENVNNVRPTEECSAGAMQRLRIRVPNIYTQLTIGQSLQDDDSQGFAYAGFGVETAGHIFMDAEQAMKLQAHGDVAIQTDKSSVSISAAKATLIHAAQSTMISGDNNLTIAGGISHGLSTNHRSDGTTPNPPEWVSQVTTTVDKINSFWTGFDTAAATVELAILAIDSAIAIKNKTFDKEMAFRTATSGYLGAWGGNVGKFSEWLGEPVAGAVGAGAGGGTVVFGDGGLVLGSRRSAGLFSYIGTTVGSATSAGMLAPWVGVTGLESLELRSCVGNAQLAAGKEVEVVGKKNVSVASRTGTVEIKGSGIHIGNEAGARQSATTAIAMAGDTIGIGAKTRLQLHGANTAVLGSHKTATVYGKVSANVASANKAGLYGKQVATVKSSNDINIANKKYTFSITNSGIVMGNIGKDWPDPPSDVPMDEVYKRIAKAGDELSVTNIKSVAAEIKAENAKAWDEWLDKAVAIDEKNCGIKIADGDIELKVKGSTWKIDSSKTKFGGSLVVKK